MGLFSIFQKEDTIRRREFSCKRDNLTIRGTEYRPAQGENLPVAIVCHGFMAFQDTVRQYAKTLARLGYAAYCFDFCGGCGATTDMSVLTEVRDLEAVIDYVQSLPYTSGRLLLMGCSQGGFVSALVAARHPEKVEKLVLFYPALCIPDDARAGKMMYARFDPSDPPQRFRCGPMKLGRCYPMDVMELDPFAAIGGYSGPVLIVHGTRDKIVHPDYAKRAAETYANAQLHMIEKGAHGFAGKRDAQAIGILKTFAALQETEMQS